MRPLLAYLRAVAGVPAWRPDVAEGPAERLLDSYGRYLRVERRLAPSTVRSHEDVARRFLSRHGEGDRLDLDGLTAAEVTAFVLAEARLRSVGSMKALLSPLRSLLRFLFVAGMTPRDLTAAVPGIANPRLGALPKARASHQPHPSRAAATPPPQAGRDVASYRPWSQFGSQFHPVRGLPVVATVAAGQAKRRRRTVRNTGPAT